MADRYALQQVGVADGTEVPAKKADGRQVGAHKRVILATKDNVNQLAVNDRLYLGKKKVGEIITAIRCTTDTSFGTTTLSIGDDTTAAKYVAAKTLTATDAPTVLGPKATTIEAGPATEDEEIWLTVLTTAIAAAVNATFEIELCGA